MAAHRVAVEPPPGGEPDRLVGVLGAVDRSIDAASGEIGSTYLDTKERIIADQQRARAVAEHLRNAIRDWRARVVIVDVTGVPAVDPAVANHLPQTAPACRLMGATPILSGISPPNTLTLAQLGVELADLDDRRRSAPGDRAGLDGPRPRPGAEGGGMTGAIAGAG